MKIDLFKKILFFVFCLILSFSLVFLYCNYINNKNIALLSQKEEKFQQQKLKIQKTFEKKIEEKNDKIKQQEKEIEEIKKQFIEKISQIKINNERIKKPKDIKALYYNTYSTKSSLKMNKLFNLAKEKKINSIVFDIKEVDGKISFELPNNKFSQIKPISNNIIKDIRETIKEFHKNNIYVIGRIVIFKDNYLTKKRPDLAIKNNITEKKVWEDKQRNRYLDPSSDEVLDYIVELASASYEEGFDEINFDYIRFPSDGNNLKNLYFPFSNTFLKEHTKTGKVLIIDNFSQKLVKKLKEKHKNIILSADVFGMTTENSGGLGIGQKIESFLLNFDYVAPMTYPSHYPIYYRGIAKPDSNPYLVIKSAINSGLLKINKLNRILLLKKDEIKNNNQLTIGGYIFDNIKERNNQIIENSQIRPWLQGFTCTWCNEHIFYTKTQFDLQKKALKENGLKSWMLWNSGGYYNSNWFLNI